MKTPDWIQPFAESSYQLFVHHDPKSHLPFNAWGLHPLYADLWLRKIYEMIVKFEEKGFKIGDYLDLFPNLSSTRLIILVNAIQYQTANLNDPEMIVKIQDFLVDSLKIRAKEDFFALEKNVELNDGQLNKILNSRPFVKVSIDESKEIGKILVALASLTHGLYGDWSPDFSYEISGPYYRDNKMILNRSFPDLRPKDIWPEIDWSYKDFSIITEYENLTAKIAYVGCHIIYSDNVIEKLVGYSFRIDEQEISGLEKLKGLREELMLIAANQYEKFMGMDFENQKIKFVFQENYQLKKLFDLVGMDWKPSKDILDRIKGKELIKDVFPSYDITMEKYMETFGANSMIKAYNSL
ncbi:MAG: hypothetical protein V1804_03485 [Patescibacteria group bacterium]